EAPADGFRGAAVERLGAHVDAVRAQRRVTDVEQIAIARSAHGAAGSRHEQRAFDSEMPEQRARGSECRVTRRPRRLNINDETLDASVTVRDGENLTSAFLEEPRDPVKPRVPIERDDGQPAERGGGDAVRGEMPD